MPPGQIKGFIHQARCRTSCLVLLKTTTTTGVDADKQTDRQTDR